MSLTTNPGSFNRTRLSVVIVTWNARDYLAGCLRSLIDTGVNHWAEIIVLDSASTDASSTMVATNFPWVRLISLTDNIGYSRGNNAAIRHATGDLILLLNPDTVIHPGTIEAMADFADIHPEMGILGPAQYGGDGQLQYEAAVNDPTVWNVFCDLTLLSKYYSKSKLFGSRKMGYWDHLDDREVPAVQGSALLVRRSVLIEIGLLDETMFVCEDIDLCVRTRQAGWKVFYLGTCSITHYGGGSTKRSPRQGFQRQIAFQSLWLFLRKHHGRFAGMELSLMVWAWSILGLLAASVQKLAAGSDQQKVNAAERNYDLVRSLGRWSHMNKLKFRHHLALPPGASESTPRLEMKAA